MALIVSAVVVTYFPMLGHGLAHDDALRSALLDEGGYGARPPRISPGAWLTYRLDRLTGGASVLHVTNLLLHALNAVLVYVLTRMLLATALKPARDITWLITGGSALTALFFALHPLRVEAVAWISQRAVLLCSLFTLLSLVCYCRAAGHRAWFVAALGAFALALVAGPSGLLLPAMLLVLDIYPLRRRLSARVWLEKLVFAVPAVVAAWFYWRANVAALPDGTVEPGTLGRVGQVCYSLVFYVWKTGWPFQLLPFHELPVPISLVSIKYIGSIAAVLIVVLDLLLWGRRVPALTAGVFVYVLLLLPMTGIVTLGPQEVADRYGYLPGVAVSVLVGVGVVALWRQAEQSWHGVALGVTLTMVPLITALGFLTHLQLRVWESPQTLWNHAAANGPWSAIVEHRRATQDVEAGQLAEAVQIWRAVTQTRPQLLDAHLGRTDLLLKRGEYDRAVDASAYGLEFHPQSAELLKLHGAALVADGQLAAAESALRRAVELAPDDGEAHSMLGHLLLMLERPVEALSAFQRAAELDGDNPNRQYDVELAEGACADQAPPDTGSN